MRKIIYFSIMLGILPLLFACGTPTGNPREGGFFWWDEELAQERQLQKRQQADALQQLVAVEQQNKQNLEQQRRREFEKLHALEQQLNGIAVESNNIGKLLRQQESRKGKQSNELKKMKSQFYANQATISHLQEELRVKASEGQTVGSLNIRVVQENADRIAAENKKLWRLIQLHN